MNVQFAREAVVEWIHEYAAQNKGFLGAYFSGSTVQMPPEAELSPASDVDVIVVLDGDEAPPKLGKFIYNGVLVEVTYIAWQELSSAEEILTSYHLAHSLRQDTIIADTSGRLRRLQAEVAEHFADECVVRERCLNVLKKIENGLQSFDTQAPWHDQVTAWLFGTGITTHVLLVAALRNPTVRRRYVPARSILRDFGHESLYEELLALLGCASLSADQVSRHVDALERTFDAAATVAKTPFFFSTDISPLARPIAIDGSRQLIRAGLHREAIFWIVATFGRCHKILSADAPDLLETYRPDFDAILADLDIHTTDDLLRRSAEVLEFLPRLWDTAESIIAAHPDIVRSR